MPLIPLMIAALPTGGNQVLSQPPIMREFRAAWVATVDNIDWPSKRTLSTDDQKAELVRIMDVAKRMNLNAIIFQVRPSADALYASRYEPWSEFLTNQQGRRPAPMYDPLEFAVNEAHRRGIELHCWFNPYRALHPAQKGPVDRQHVSKTNPGVVKQYGSYQWMDPSEPFVQQRTLDVMLDVVRRYDIDGVHIDDYFYPYKSYANGADFPDEPNWRKYVDGGGTLSRSDWRRKNVDDFIHRVYDEIKGAKRWVKFGISPFGIYRPNQPAGISSGVDQYADLYADARRWLAEGWCDYYTPQLYWPIKQTAQSYPKLLDWWMEQNAHKHHIWPGNFTSRTNPSDGNWPVTEVLDQIQVTRQKGATGNVHFSMKAFLQNYGGITDALRNGPYREPALVPASPWLDNGSPNPPRIEVRRDAGGQVTIQCAPDRDKDIRFYAVSLMTDKWLAPIVGSGSLVTVNATADFDFKKVSVIAIDRVGNASRASVMDVPAR